MRNSIKAAMLCTALGLIMSPQSSFAADGAGLFNKENLLLRVRAIDIAPSDTSTVNIGGDANVGNSVVPEFDISYFFTKNIAAELILATARHDLTYTGGVDLGKTMILPPTLTVQYHFTPEGSFSPYLGAGLNYSMFYNENAANGFTDLNVKGGVGYALQAGADYWINDNWGLNVDVKKIFLNVDATLNNGAIKADVDLDPWVVGAGVSYRF